MLRHKHFYMKGRIAALCIEVGCADFPALRCICANGRFRLSEYEATNPRAGTRLSSQVRGSNVVQIEAVIRDGAIDSYNLAAFSFLFAFKRFEENDRHTGLLVHFLISLDKSVCKRKPVKPTLLGSHQEIAPLSN